jgi:uncharacterized membrane protein YeaQ/YmgE (transglycosylase-associated protein family)
MNELLIWFAAPMLLLAGLTCGWMTEAFSPAGGFGLRGDMALGFAGSVALAVALHGLNWFSGVGLFATFLIGLTGAAGILVAQRALWRTTSPQR